MRLKISLLFLAFLLAACSSTYYKTMEGFGVEKRDILVDRVEDARDAQDDAAEQFASALDQFRSMVEVDGGDLEKTYDRLSKEFERSQARADEVSERIDSIESVAEDLFEEFRAFVPPVAIEFRVIGSDDNRRGLQARFEELQLVLAAEDEVPGMVSRAVHG